MWANKLQETLDWPKSSLNTQRKHFDHVQLIISMLTQSLKIGTVLSTALLNQPFYKLEMSRIYRRDQLPPQGSYLRYQIQNISSASVEGIIKKSTEEVKHIWPPLLLLTPQMH